MNVIEDNRAMPFATVDFHNIRIDGGLGATTRGCRFPLKVGQRILGIDKLSNAQCEMIVREIHWEEVTVCGRFDMILDFDSDTWHDL